MTGKIDSSTSARVALVGTGYIAESHVAALGTVSGARIEAVCDLARGRAERFASQHGVPRVYSSLDSLLSDGQIDVVHVLTPPNAHHAPADAALRSGVDVLVEKPLSQTSDACRSLTELARREGRVLGASHNFLFHEAYEQLVADVRSGRLGLLDQVEIVWNKSLGQLRGGPWGAWMLQEPTNILFEVGPHLFAHLVHLVGRPDRIVVHADDEISLPRGLRFFRRWEILAWRGRTSIRLRLSFIDGYPEHYVHVRGTQALGHCDLENGAYTCFEHTTQPLVIDRFLNVSRASGQAFVQAGGVLSHFVLAKAGVKPIATPFERTIARSVQSFYAGRRGSLDERLGGALATEAVSIAEWVAREAKLPPSSTVVPDPAPPSQTEAALPTVLVTGGSGFIGRALVRRLRQDGHVVRLLVRDPAGLPMELQADGVEVVRGDFTDLHSMASALSGIRVVYHLAKGTGPGWQQYLASDVEPTQAFAKLCLERGIERFIYTSSIAIYDAGRRAGTITEATAPAKGGDSYAHSKVENERNLLDLYQHRKFPVVIFRPGIVLGRGGSPLHWGIAGWPYPSVAQLWGSGNFQLPTVLVDDCVEAMVLALDKPGIEGRSYNLVGPPMITANDYLDELETRAGIKLRRIATPSWRYFVEAIGKWLIKSIARDPEAQRPTYAEWDGRTFAARFDGSKAERELAWTPTRDRAALIRGGIHDPVDDWFELNASAKLHER